MNLRVKLSGVALGPALVVWLAHAPLLASPERGAAQRAAAARASAGWAALESGNVAGAVRVADALLSASPRDHAAVLLKLSALASGGNPVEALDAYDRWREARRHEDPYLLALVAEAVLRQLATSSVELSIRLGAAEALAEHGVAGGAELVAKTAPTAGTAGAIALAKTGSAEGASAALESLPRLAGSAKTEAIQQVADARLAGAESALTRLLSDPDPMIRASAAQGLGRMGANGATAALLRLLNDPVGAVRQSAAPALVALGRSEGEPLVTAMLDSGVPDIVLAVAEALPNDVVRWQSHLSRVLEADDPIGRLRAARLLRNADRESAERVIRQGLESGNLAIREEAARTWTADGVPVATGDLKKLLRDPSAWVRLAAARALLDV